MKGVYLAGPISGLNYAGAVDWRDAVARELGAAGIAAYSPMRAKGYLRDVDSLDPSGHGEFSVLSSARGITTRDYFDTMRCDVLLANLLGAERPSLGTVMEIAWAFTKRTPVVAVIEESGNPHDHAMVCEAIGFRVTSLAAGVGLCKAILATS